MSLHTKLDNHQKQLKAFLEEHAAMVEARLASIEARLVGPEASEEADRLKDDIQGLMDSAKQKDEDILNLLYEIGTLRDTCSRLSRELEASGQKRYPGAYYLGPRSGKLNSVGEVIVVLGGDNYLGETLGISSANITRWRSNDAIPPAQRQKIEELLRERGYFANKLLFRVVSNEDRWS